jgi:hypothetical protein
MCKTWFLKAGKQYTGCFRVELRRIFGSKEEEGRKGMKKIK